MSPDKYHLRPQTNGLTPGYQYVEVPGSPNILGQATYQMAFDGLPRTPDHYFGVTSPSASHQLPSDYNIASPMQVSQAQVSRNYPLSNAFDGQNTDGYHGFMGNALNGPYSQDEFNVPRYAAQYDMTQLSDGDMMMDGYEPSSYMLDSNKPNNQHTSAGRSNSIYDPIDNSCDFPRPSIRRSPKLEYDDMANDPISSDRALSFMLPSRETSEDCQSSREMTATNVEDQATDEPYAKLIYRALMSIPNHSMVLQEIYQWFRDNTSKGNSDTKGWMNSIRHNLSMNAAFRKTERRVSGDETKKSTEWVLEDWAIKDGVQSTTRYRYPKGPKGGNKKLLKHNTSTTCRQNTTRKGELCGKAKLQRQRAKEDHPNPRSSIQRIDTGRSQAPHQVSSPIEQRQISPLTPSPRTLESNPYFHLKSEPMESPYEYSLGDVQGVYMLDNGPLFSQDQDEDSPFFNGYSVTNNGY